MYFLGGIVFWTIYWIFGGILFLKNKPLHNQIFNVIKILLINMTISICVGYIVDNIKHLLKDRIVLNIYGQILVLILSAELWFDLSHRLLHTRWFYRFHKLHHQFKYPYGLTGLYAHPVEFIFCNLASTIWTLYWIEYSPIVIYIWNAYLAINTINSHHKYFEGPHLIHHRKLNVNFGSIGILDVLLGTYEK